MRTICHLKSSYVLCLFQLSKHFHPSVALFASQLLAGTIVSYTGNPLQDFTATRFLDRFVYRNPKQKLIGKYFDALYYQDCPQAGVSLLCFIRAFAYLTIHRERSILHRYWKMEHIFMVLYIYKGGLKSS